MREEKTVFFAYFKPSGLTFKCVQISFFFYICSDIRLQSLLHSVMFCSLCYAKEITKIDHFMIWQSRFLHSWKWLIYGNIFIKYLIWCIWKYGSSERRMPSNHQNLTIASSLATSRSLSYIFIIFFFNFCWTRFFDQKKTSLVLLFFNWYSVLFLYSTKKPVLYFVFLLAFRK